MTSVPTVGEFMDRRFTTFAPEVPLKKAMFILVKKNLLAAIVVDKEDQPVGILSEKDCLKLMMEKAYSQRPWGNVQDYMHEAPGGIPSTMPAPEAGEIMIKHNYRRLPVVDNGKLVGQITRRDLILGMHRRLYPV
jgi:CBS domain-containing protein